MLPSRSSTENNGQTHVCLSAAISIFSLSLDLCLSFCLSNRPAAQFGISGRERERERKSATAKKIVLIEIDELLT